MSRVLILVATGVLAACVAPFVSENQVVEDDRSSIVGGEEEWGFPQVGTLAASLGSDTILPFCTATPISPTVLLTAAHCADAFVDVGNNVVFAQLNPDNTGPIFEVNAGSQITHPEWSMDDGRYLNDIAVVPLRNPINADVFPEMHRVAETSADVSTHLKVVGFGVSDPPDGGGGIKRSIDMEITEILDQYFVMLIDGWRGVCYGDSGGPSFVLGEYRNTQWGVHARTQVESCGPAEDTSVGYFFESFVRPQVLALDPTADDCGDGVCTGLEIEGECPLDCAPYECGDETIEGPEVCDDGNTSSGDGCSEDCLSDESCGNGITDLTPGEVCDDGNVTSGDGCSADCRSDESCGNTVVDSAVGEVCDDGDTTDGDGCSADCLSDESCGNSIVDDQVNEVCDDGNTRSADGCSQNCLSNETCGNGYWDYAVGEACDDGNNVSGDGCSADCQVAEGCGNGLLEEAYGEICDDGNEQDGDGCSSNCHSDESCGNGVLDEIVGETCDDGNVSPDDECPADCGVPHYLGKPSLGGGCACHSARVHNDASLINFLGSLIGSLFF